MDEAHSLVIGIDLGGTKMLAAGIYERGEILHLVRQQTLAEEGSQAVIARIAALCHEITTAVGRPIAAVCIGVPGAVDGHTGIVHRAPNLQWAAVPLASLLSAQIGGVPVFLDNDVRVAVLGEHAYGVGRGTQTMVGIFVGTGIGGGLVIDGHLHLGKRGSAGEVGHMMLDPKGPRCSCGRRGCVEAFASRTAMERDVLAIIAKKHRESSLPRLMKKKGGRLTSSVIAEALAEGDRVMEKVLARAQKRLGQLIASVVNLTDPEVVVIGGGIAERLDEAFVAPIREAAYERFFLQRDRDQVRIVSSELKERAAPLGAAMVARKRLAGLSASIYHLTDRA